MQQESRKPKIKRKAPLIVGDEISYEAGVSQDIGDNTWLKATFGIRRTMHEGETPASAIADTCDFVEQILDRRFAKLVKSLESKD